MSRFHSGLCSHPEGLAGGPGRTACGGEWIPRRKPSPAVRSDVLGTSDKRGREPGSNTSPHADIASGHSWGYFVSCFPDASSFGELPTDC